MTAMTGLEEKILPPTEKVEERAPYVSFLNILLFSGTVFIMGFVSQHMESLPIERAPEIVIEQSQPLALPDELAVLKEELEKTKEELEQVW